MVFQFIIKSLINKIEFKSSIEEHTQNTMTAFEGHFWVELPCGKIIDPYFEEYDEILKLNGLKMGCKYKEATEDIQDEMKIKHIIPKLIAVKKYYRLGQIDLKAGYCNINAIINLINHPEGTIKYGDMGWECKKNNKIWWEYENGWKGRGQPIDADMFNTIFQNVKKNRQSIL